jgi:hypothetical protein
LEDNIIIIILPGGTVKDTYLDSVGKVKEGIVKVGIEDIVIKMAKI